MNKFLIIVAIVFITFNFVACSTNNTTKQQIYENVSNMESSNTDNNSRASEFGYFSVLESTSNNGLRFNISLKDFIENYNQLVIEYSNQYSIVDKAFVVGADFKKQNDSQENINGVQCDTYICNSTLFGYQNDYGICVSVEKDSHCIAEVSIAADSELMDSFSDEQRFLNTIQHHIVYRALMNELSSEDCYVITDGIKENSKNCNVPAYFKKGVAFCLDFSYEQSIGIRYARIYPCTIEQWKESPGFKNIPIESNDLDKHEKSINKTDLTIVYEIKSDETEKDYTNVAKELLDFRLKNLGYTNATINAKDNIIEITLPPNDGIEDLAENFKKVPCLKFVDYENTELLTANDIEKVGIQKSNMADNTYNIILTFNEQGKNKLKEASEYISQIPNPNNYINIKLDDEIIFSSLVLREIDSASFIVLQGKNYNISEASDIATQIEYSMRKFTMEIVEIR